MTFHGLRRSITTKKSITSSTEPIISQEPSLDIPLNRRTRILDLTIILISVIYVIAAIVRCYREPYLLTLLILPPPLILAYRFGLGGGAMRIAISGAIIGTFVEVFCVAGGLWTYTETGGLPFIPPFLIPLWACFSLALWIIARSVLGAGYFTYTRRITLLLALAGIAIEILIFVILGDNTRLAIVALLPLAIASLLAARKKAALIIMGAGGLLGPICEAPPIAAGAWIYANPEVLGMPGWLPPAYAVFAVLVAYATMAASATMMGFKNP